MALSGEKIKDLIEQTVARKAKGAARPLYREPLVGYARADDGIFFRFKDVVDEKHFMPTDLLPEAKTVVAFFLPYKKEIVVNNRGGTTASRIWAETYAFTNTLIGEICEELHASLLRHGINSGWLLPTYQFCKQKLKAQWSHRHVAYACGLGTFGKNNLLITSSGCAGRFGTIVLDVELDPTPRLEKVHHCMAESGCTYCQKHCPVRAFDGPVFERHRCYNHCLFNDELFPDLDCVEVCGKCSTGPCAYLE